MQYTFFNICIIHVFFISIFLVARLNEKIASSFFVFKYVYYLLDLMHYKTIDTNKSCAFVFISSLHTCIIDTMAKKVKAC